jgi:hypothetical protein
MKLYQVTLRIPAAPGERKDRLYAFVAMAASPTLAIATARGVYPEYFDGQDQAVAEPVGQKALRLTSWLVNKETA